jgi:hypothetical protein
MKILILKSKKTSARKYSATPVSKPSHPQTKAGQDIVSVFLFMQNSRHTLHLHMKNCGASFERFLYHSIQLNNRISCTTQASRLRGLSPTGYTFQMKVPKTLRGTLLLITVKENFSLYHYPGLVHTYAISSCPN